MIQKQNVTVNTAGRIKLLEPVWLYSPRRHCQTEPDRMPTMSISDKRAFKRSRTEAAEIIDQVRKHPCIWERGSALYRNRSAKEHAWKEVCRAIDSDYENMSPSDRYELVLATVHKWNNLRDSYRKSYKPNKSGSPGLVSTYVWAERMSFLNRILKLPEGVTIKKPKLETDDSSEECSEALQTEWLQPEYEDESETISKIPDATSGRGSLTSVLVNLLDKEEDEDRAFFKSITPAVKALPEEAKFVFRIQVMKVLNTLRKQQGDSTITAEYSAKYSASDTE